MKHDYTEDIETALDLITEFGMKVKVGSESTVAAFVNKKQDALNNPTGAGGTVLSTVKMEKVALVPGGLKSTPQVGMTITSDKVTWTITSVDDIAPAGVSVLYKLGVEQ